MDQTAPLEVGIPVIDLDGMLAPYERVLSCVEVRGTDIPAGLAHALGSGDAGYVAVWLRTPGGEVIKLFRPPVAPAPDTPRASLTERTGVAFVTFYCRDLEGVLRTAEEHGAGAPLRACADRRRRWRPAGVLRRPRGQRDRVGGTGAEAGLTGRALSG